MYYQSVREKIYKSQFDLTMYVMCYKYLINYKSDADCLRFFQLHILSNVVFSIMSASNIFEIFTIDALT